ncbi:restriction endonuclease [Kitasatospora sp. NPDC059088]|uniref:restriction endonuclease n=1 Tax=Kitasatospora sp. NPDC059088 TaxID=3346722 RepID=UPI0036A5B2A5
MIIDRHAAVTPTRYDDRDLRRRMGAEIAAADSDDLLAAWIWSAEARLCRTVAEASDALRDDVHREHSDVLRRIHAAWQDRGGDRTPVALRERVQGALERAKAELDRVLKAAESHRVEANRAWRRMRGSFGLNPTGAFLREGDRERSPVQDSFRQIAFLEECRRDITQVTASLREEIHVAALEEDSRRSRAASGALTPEEHFLRSVHVAAHALLERAGHELGQLERRERCPGRSEGDSELAHTKYVSAARPDRRWAEVVRDEHASGERLVQRATELWDAMADCGELLGGAPEAGDGVDLMALVADLGMLSREVAASRARLEGALRQHVADQHRVALRINRRHDWVRSGAALSLEGVRGLHHRQFERFVAELLLRDGFEVEQHQGGPGDQGADVIALCPDGRRYVVQCKHTAVDANVGTPDLQRFKGTAWDVHGADVAMLVTNGGFSRNALSFAGQHGIQLIGSSEVWRWGFLGDPLEAVIPGRAQDAAVFAQRKVYQRLARNLSFGWPK